MTFLAATTYNFSAADLGKFENDLQELNLISTTTQGSLIELGICLTVEDIGGGNYSS